MRNRRPLHFISREKEWQLIQELLINIDSSNFDPKDTVILMVSPDYSASVSMILSHAWSVKGEILPIIAVYVPYPDEDHKPFREMFISQYAEIAKYKKIICVEAGIIRGGNWTWLLNAILDFQYSREDITLVALCENVHSKLKSDYVGEYYNDLEEELTFYYEHFNKHWEVR